MFDPEEFGKAMGTAIREAVAPLQRRIGELEAQLAKPVDVSAAVERAVASAVAALPAPKDGKDASPVDHGAIIKEVLAQIPVPSNGKDGVDGRAGQDCDMEAVRGLIAEAVKSIPAPKDGRDGIDGKDGAHGADGKDGRDGVDGQKGLDGKDGLAGANGVDGKEGRPGIDGAKGADGLGLAGAMIDRDGALQITLTNGEVKSLGKVVGKDGDHGRDGASFESFELEYLPDSHEIAVKATSAGRTKELRYPAGGIRPAGYWREGTKAVAGEAWVHDGSLWIAKSPTAAKPESRSDDWIIAARKGRDGERGGKGADGSPPAPIKLKD